MGRYHSQRPPAPNIHADGVAGGSLESGPQMLSAPQVGLTSLPRTDPHFQKQDLTKKHQSRHWHLTFWCSHLVASLSLPSGPHFLRPMVALPREVLAPLLLSLSALCVLQELHRHSCGASRHVCSTSYCSRGACLVPCTGKP